MSVMIDLGEGFRGWAHNEAPRHLIRSLLDDTIPDPAYSLGRIGSLEVRLASTKKEIKKAQRLRYKVFYEEMTATPDLMSRLKRRDIDPFDAFCDHLLVVDHKEEKSKVIGTYRLLRQDMAARGCGFYTANEFDIAPMIAAHPTARFLELGRSCVLKAYRDKRTVELLWHGIWAYVRRNRIDIMFGCASLYGIDPDALALPLSFLHHTASAEGALAAKPVAERAIDMNRMDAQSIDARKALHALPPLIKGYLRLGARFGNGAVIDRQFGTTDVLVVLPVSAINPRYIDYYGEEATRYAA